MQSPPPTSIYRCPSAVVSCRKHLWCSFPYSHCASLAWVVGFKKTWKNTKMFRIMFLIRLRRQNWWFMVFHTPVVRPRSPGQNPQSSQLIRSSWNCRCSVISNQSLLDVRDGLLNWRRRNWTEGQTEADPLARIRHSDDPSSLLSSACTIWSLNYRPSWSVQLFRSGGLRSGWRVEGRDLVTW